MSGKGAGDYARDYTKPELRERLKEEIKASDRGAAKGRWSARKSQLLTREYERAGGDYKHKGEQTESQKDLEQWGDQEWQTRDGGAKARGEHGTARYLPELAWKLLSKAEREKTDDRKKGESEQFVDNTEAAREARKAAQLLDMRADEAVKAVRGMTTTSALDRAHRAEGEFGKKRKTVLAAIERQRREL